MVLPAAVSAPSAAGVVKGRSAIRYASTGHRVAPYAMPVPDIHHALCQYWTPRSTMRYASTGHRVASRRHIASLWCCGGERREERGGKRREGERRESEKGAGMNETSANETHTQRVLFVWPGVSIGAANARGRVPSRSSRCYAVRGLCNGLATVAFQRFGNGSERVLLNPDPPSQCSAELPEPPLSLSLSQ
eukprot:1841857-Rhodomonas_salina.2